MKRRVDASTFFLKHPSFSFLLFSIDARPVSLVFLFHFQALDYLALRVKGQRLLFNLEFCSSAASCFAANPLEGILPKGRTPPFFFLCLVLVTVSRECLGVDRLCFFPQEGGV